MVKMRLFPLQMHSAFSTAIQIRPGSQFSPILTNNYYKVVSVRIRSSHRRTISSLLRMPRHGRIVRSGSDP